ncbi:MAG: hypothetical protein K2X66_00910, partial [Cyanobacteria bacterium]|nr:hypothetical protein [Cyanobacteriota bacterium]
MSNRIDFNHPAYGNSLELLKKENELLQNRIKGSESASAEKYKEQIRQDLNTLKSDEKGFIATLTPEEAAARKKWLDDSQKVHADRMKFQMSLSPEQKEICKHIGQLSCKASEQTGEALAKTKMEICKLRDALKDSLNPKQKELESTLKSDVATRLKDNQAFQSLLTPEQQKMREAIEKDYKKLKADEKAFLESLTKQQREQLPPPPAPPGAKPPSKDAPPPPP